MGGIAETNDCVDGSGIDLVASGFEINAAEVVDTNIVEIPRGNEVGA